MQLGMVGLGRMGANLVRRAMAAGHDCVVYDVNQDAVKALSKDGAIGSNSLKDFVGKLDAPRNVWVMVPVGELTDKTVKDLGDLLSRDDIIIDGGN
jgi:6-phosphogluconate dehydrogenase